jgi:ERF superfamily
MPHPLNLIFSESISEIAAALSRAQAAFPVVKKDNRAEVRSVKGSYAYQYASLGSVLDAIRGPLAANGLAYTQPLEETTEGTYVVTLLLHTSGQWICSRLRVPTHDLIGAQAVGSYITYARRYSIASLTGVAIEEDDDGRAAQQQASRRGESLSPREPGCDDGQPAPAPAATPGREPRTKGKIRNGNWLAEAAAKQGLVDEFVEIGNRLCFPAKLEEWSAEQVANAIQIRSERLVQ